MAWKDLRAELEAEFGALSNHERASADRLGKRAGENLARREWRERDQAIPETKAQRTHKRRLARAKRVSGLVRGQRGVSTC